MGKTTWCTFLLFVTLKMRTPNFLSLSVKKKKKSFHLIRLKPLSFLFFENFIPCVFSTHLLLPFV